MQEDRWERDALKEVALASIREQRRTRRWNIFFRFLLVGYLLALFALTPSCQFGGGSSLGPHTAVVRITGPIMDDSQASAESVIEGLDAAFEAEGVRGVVLDINSPGGSPVQAGRINDEIRRLRALHPDIPVYAVLGDIAASGAYYVAVGADRIYVDKASMVGSIGVLMNGFGFTGTMEKLGVERRLYTSGAHKAFLDPFSPQNPDNVAHIEGMLRQIHQQFIDEVKEGRGERLSQDPKIFSGLVWTGAESIDLGLADEFGSVHYVARDVIGAEDLVDYTPRQDFLSSVTDKLGVSISRRLQLDMKTLW